MPTLYLIPTLLADDTAAQVLPPHIPAIIEKTDAYFVENVRSARRFISGLKTNRVIDETTFFDLDKDTPPADTRRQIQELTERKRNAGVLSEAGCPGVAEAMCTLRADTSKKLCIFTEWLPTSRWRFSLEQLGAALRDP